MPKDELALGKIPLPTIYIGGTLFPQTITVPHPSLDLELMIKEINVDLTTDVLNQLLVVQIAFIKVRNIEIHDNKILLHCEKLSMTCVCVLL